MTPDYNIDELVILCSFMTVLAFFIGVALFSIKRGDKDD